MVDSAAAATLRAWRHGWVAVALVSIAGLGLRSLIPAYVVWNSPHDDESFVRSAAALLDGRWVGSWADHPDVPHIALAKGPGYGLFLATIRDTGLPPQVAAYVIYLLGGLLVAVALRPHLATRWFVSLYTLLALNPVVFSHYFSQVYRDQLIAALALLCVGVAVTLARRYARTDAVSPRRLAATAGGTVALGLLFGIVRITRSDAVWVLLASVLVFVLIVGAPRPGRRVWLVAASGIAFVGLLTAAVPQGVALLNERWHGVRIADDYSEGSFAEAMTLWAAVSVPGDGGFPYITAAHRVAVYEVSPTARRLTDELENMESFWIDHSCRQLEGTVNVCEDYGPYAVWAIRDAAVRAGVDSPASFQDFFGAVADEIERACASGALECRPSGLAPGIPRVDSIPKRVTAANVASYVMGALTYRMGTATQTLPTDGDPAVAIWDSTVNGSRTGAALIEAGNYPSVVAQQEAVSLLGTLYGWLTVPGLVAAAWALLSGRLWRSHLGQLGLAVLVSWAANVAIISAFHATGNRHEVGMPLYTMPSQSYLLLGLVLSAAALTASWRPVLNRRLDGPA